MRLPQLSLPLLFAALPALAAVRLEDIPDPRPASAVTDLTGTLAADVVESLDRLNQDVRAQTGGEMLVVVVGSIGGADPRGFATSLFNRWGVGDRTRNDGFLLFVALEDRAAEAILGDGIDDDARTRASDEVMQGVVVPAFRRGDPQGAIWQGSLAYARRIFGARPAGTTAEGGAAAATKPQPLAGTGAQAPVGGGGGGLGAGAAVAGGGAGLVGLWTGGRALLGLRRRRCPKCRQPMARLDEVRDDAYLSDGERKEESVRSVNYVIWQCPPCGETEKVRHGAFFTSYGKCPGCGFKTRLSTSTTLVQATHDHGGRVRVTEECANCGHRSSSERSTARLTRSSSSSGGFGSSGGGRSSGRGSSGRW